MVGRPGRAIARPRPVKMLDHIRRGYGDAADGWSGGAEIVYGPLAQSLVDESPVALGGAVVADVGAGTGAASAALHRGRCPSPCLRCHGGDARP